MPIYIQCRCIEHESVCIYNLYKFDSTIYYYLLASESILQQLQIKSHYMLHRRHRRREKNQYRIPNNVSESQNYHYHHCGVAIIDRNATKLRDWRNAHTDIKTRKNPFTKISLIPSLEKHEINCNSLVISSATLNRYACTLEKVGTRGGEPQNIINWRVKQQRQQITAENRKKKLAAKNSK